MTSDNIPNKYQKVKRYIFCFKVNSLNKKDIRIAAAKTELIMCKGSGKNKMKMSV
ncbi:hypothetical protein KCTCHS21_16500 [Cohnella abietis]|uniref:Uncharacterized protein n=1 Tax=Cohnella abietis TaxID=2507935 RepID=A0A3T1D2I4_9BACL|nr:hypothetical protein KCTCHS21_16500 [Cohnella abietis]